jgi:hypothetical protein
MNKILGLVVLVLGIILSLVTLWAGTYFVYKYTYTDWQQFPTFMTAMLCFIGGVVLVGVGANRLSS